MTEGKLQLHGTRFLNREPTIDQQIDAVPPAFRIPNTPEVLQFAVKGYDRLQVGDGIIALGKLSIRILNTFFIVNPQRAGSITTVEIADAWEESGVKLSRAYATQVIRSIEALDAIRQQIDGEHFVTGGSRGSGHVGHYSIAEDIIFEDGRFD